MEDVPQDSDRLGNQIVSQDSIECSIRSGPRGKEAVGYGLGVQVGKLIRLEVGDEMFLECFIEAKNPLRACTGCLAQFLFDNLIPEEARPCSELFCKTLSGELRRQRELKELLEQGEECYGMLGRRNGLCFAGIYGRASRTSATRRPLR